MPSARPARGRRGRLLPAAVLVFMGLLLSSCLAPDEYDPTGHEPIGHLDSVTAAGTSLRVRGWALDPNTSASVAVTVAYLGKNVNVTADAPRPDVAAVYPAYGAAHGFDFTTPSLGTGVGQVCVWVENVGPGSRGRLLGCHDVRLGSDDSVGSFQSAEATAATRVRVRGWGLDLQAPDQAVDVSWKLNDGPWQYYPTGLPSPEVNTFLGTTGNHGFDFEIIVPLGRNTVCMRVPAYGRGGAAELGCRTVLNESLTPVGTGADLLSVLRVKPRAGHPLETMSRDAGVSTRLSDGSLMWFFGDTSDVDDGGSLRYFVNNTAAWASGGEPATTTDAVRAEPVRPYLSLAPVEAFTQPCPEGWDAVLWPASAVTVPASATVDHVYVYFGNVCLGGAWKMAGRGMGVARFVYDRSAPPDGTPLQGAVLGQTIFPSDQRYGTAAHFDGTHIYVYQCHTPGDDGEIHWPSDPLYGPCTVARVAPDDAADPAAYRYWSAGSWVPQASAATGMTVPGAGQGPSADKQLPPSGFSITKDPHHGYLMVYSPWPGLTGEVMVRRSASPTGPWSSPQTYHLPGCEDHAQGSGRFCYAATAQPAFSTSARIGIGYFDELVSLGPARGGYLAGTLARRW